MSNTCKSTITTATTKQMLSYPSLGIYNSVMNCISARMGNSTFKDIRNASFIFMNETNSNSISSIPKNTDVTMAVCQMYEESRCPKRRLTAMSIMPKMIIICFIFKQSIMSFTSLVVMAVDNLMHLQTPIDSESFPSLPDRLSISRILH